MNCLDIDKLDEYEIIAEIGRGGMGTVYQAISGNDVVAIKICNSNDQDLIRRFKREVRAVQKIQHNNVMPIITENLENDPPYYIMPLADMSVYDMLDELSCDHNKAIDIFLQICYGIQAAHLAGECHRDIKPQNALLLPDGRIVVSDFGLVKFMDRDSTMLTKTGMWVGTEMYMAPEQFLPGGSRDSNYLTDIYQLGKTLYQIYTGKYPAVMSEDGIPANLWYIIQKATKQNPKERFSDVSELIDALNEYIASLDPSSNPQESFLIELRSINDQLSVGLYHKASVDRLINILMLESQVDDIFLNMFDRVPEKILSIYAKDYPDKLLPLIEKHAQIISKCVIGRSFDYAETVAQKMNLVYQSTTNNNLKACAIKSVLIAAVDLNRFRAMNVFNKLLISIQDNDEAFIIADMLKHNINRYKRIYTQISKDQLHYHIQQQWDKASM